MCLQVNEFLKANLVPEMSVEEIAMGFVRVANEAMCRPIRNLTQGKGYGENHNRIFICCFKWGSNTEYVLISDCRMCLDFER